MVAIRYDNAHIKEGLGFRKIYCISYLQLSGKPVWIGDRLNRRAYHEKQFFQHRRNGRTAVFSLGCMDHIPRIWQYINPACIQIRRRKRACAIIGIVSFSSRNLHWDISAAYCIGYCINRPACICAAWVFPHYCLALVLCNASNQLSDFCKAGSLTGLRSVPFQAVPRVLPKCSGPLPSLLQKFPSSQHTETPCRRYYKMGVLLQNPHFHSDPIYHTVSESNRFEYSMADSLNP